MEFVQTEIPEVVIIKPTVYGDNRGYFFESFKKESFDQHIRKTEWVQANESFSTRGVARGLHYQLPPYSQSKLVRAVTGAVLDVAVDVRKGSPTFGKAVAVELNDVNKWQLYVPRGFAHGFVVLSESAIFSYQVDNVYAPKHEAGIDLFDPSIGINWCLPIDQLILSGKDKVNPKLADAVVFDFNQNLYE